MNVVNHSVIENLHHRILGHLQIIYPDLNHEPLLRDLLAAAGLEREQDVKCPTPHTNLWNQQTVLAITYGDSIQSENVAHLHTLHGFLNKYLKDVFSGVHILPFFPWSSDDGFSVIDYLQVNQGMGEWEDIEKISADFPLMADLVINHCSARSRWFENYKKCVAPGKDYFVEVEPDVDISAVVRPRTSPLLQEVDTLNGKRHVWCTFSHDQVDLNFRNPEVLLEFVRIIRFYLERGVKMFRLDAVAFLWKEPGGSCIHLPQTHEVVRLLRTLIEHRDPKAILLSETNVPNGENLSYFGNANEAHIVYNFSLPPLLLHALVSGDANYLKTWMMSMPPAQHGTTYLSFIASHDGIGLRPVEGLLSEKEVNEVAGLMQRFGARVSWRALENGENRPYEINISFYDAMRGTLHGGEDGFQFARFICAHTIMLALEGIPAIYIHSLFGTENDYQRLEHTGRNRAINRHQWQLQELEDKLASPYTHHGKVFQALTRLINVRRAQPAFHPNATQYTLHLGPQLFAFWRQSSDRRQSIFCINNVSDQPQLLPLARVNLIELDTWRDLISGDRIEDLQSEVMLKPYQSLWLSNV